MTFQAGFSKDSSSPATLPELLDRNAGLYPGKAAVICGGSRVTYGALRQAADTVGHWLAVLGCGKGDRVGLLLHKTPEAVVAFLGAARAGCVVFPLDPNQSISTLEGILRLTRPGALVVHEDFLPLLAAVNHGLARERLLVLGASSGHPFRNWEDLAAASLDPPEVAVEPEDPVYLNFTSGTTGTPKGAVTTHAHIHWNNVAIVESLRVSQDDVYLCMFPVFLHPHDLFGRSLCVGGTLVLLESISPKAIARAVSEHRVTSMLAIASLYETLVRQCERSPFKLDSLKSPASGGMHTSASLARRFRDCFGVSILPVWGSTETTGIALATPAEGPFKEGSMGRPCPGYQVKVVDETGVEVPPGRAGEMVIRGPAVCSHYFENPDETARCIRDGWFHTGDLVSRDEEGFYFFVERKARMMKVAGLKVSPLEIEEVLRSHEGIAEVVVVKVEDPLHGELPKAVIVPREGMELDAGEIRRFCEKRLSRNKVPRVIEFRSHLPKTPGGKILWRRV